MKESFENNDILQLLENANNVNFNRFDIISLYYDVSTPEGIIGQYKSYYKSELQTAIGTFKRCPDSIYNEKSGTIKLDDTILFNWEWIKEGWLKGYFKFSDSNNNEYYFEAEEDKVMFNNMDGDVVLRLRVKQKSIKEFHFEYYSTKKFNKELVALLYLLFHELIGIIRTEDAMLTSRTSV